MVEEEPRTYHLEGDVLVTRPFDLPKAANNEAVRVGEQGDHGLWMIRCFSPAVLAVLRLEEGEVHLLDTIENEPAR